VPGALFAGVGAGQLLPVQNLGRTWLTRWYSARAFNGFAIGFALVGAALVIYTVVANAGWADFGIGGLWLVMAANCFLVARQIRRREQLDEAAPAAGYDVPALAEQGRKIEAIKRYRELNPGVGLREAKRVIDEL
jgi:hypothetical protein